MSIDHYTQVPRFITTDFDLTPADVCVTVQVRFVISGNGKQRVSVYVPSANVGTSACATRQSVSAAVDRVLHLAADQSASKGKKRRDEFFPEPSALDADEYEDLFPRKRASNGLHPIKQLQYERCPWLRPMTAEEDAAARAEYTERQTALTDAAYAAYRAECAARANGGK